MTCERCETRPGTIPRAHLSLCEPCAARWDAAQARVRAHWQTETTFARITCAGEAQ